MFNPQEHMLKLKGKEYLQVMWRLVWFREDCPLWSIDTTLENLDLENKHAVFRAVISDENGVPKSTGYGSESARDFGDYIEKAETKAVGRALAMLGYGTQFAPELDEEERIVDSPVERNRPAEPEKAPQNSGIHFVCEDCGAKLQVYPGTDGKPVGLRKHAEGSKARFGKVLCLE